MAEVVRIYSTSGTTGAPSYIPLTRTDLAAWIEISCRSYAASGVAAGQRLVSTYGAGPFVAGADARRLPGARPLPYPGRARGTPSGCWRRSQLLKPDAVALTPSYALHLAERAAARGHRPRRLQRRAAARRRRAGRRRAGAARAAGGGVGREGHRGDGDRRHRRLALGRVRGAGRHAFLRPRLRAFRADRPRDRRVACRWRTAPRASWSTPTSASEAAPLLRFRSRDHVRLRAGALRLRPHRAAGALHRPHRRHADRARREPLPDRRARGGGRLRARGERRHRHPPAPPRREAGAAAAGGGRARRGPRRRRRRWPTRSAARLRERLLVATEIELAPWASLPRSDYKSKLVDWSGAET